MSEFFEINEKFENDGIGIRYELALIDFCVEKLSSELGENVNFNIVDCIVKSDKVIVEYILL